MAGNNDELTMEIRADAELQAVVLPHGQQVTVNVAGLAYGILFQDVELSPFIDAKTIEAHVFITQPPAWQKQ